MDRQRLMDVGRKSKTEEMEEVKQVRRRKEGERKEHGKQLGPSNKARDHSVFALNSYICTPPSFPSFSLRCLSA